MSSTLSPSPRPAIPRVKAMSAEVSDFDRCSGRGCSKALFKMTLLLLLLVGENDWWMIGSGANLTRGDACCKEKIEDSC